MNLNFQLALPKELEEVFSHFQKVIFHMQSSGLDQWDQVYPDLETLKEDIRKNDLYLASAFTNKYLKPKDYLRLSFGLKLQFF